MNLDEALKKSTPAKEMAELKQQLARVRYRYNIYNIYTLSDNIKESLPLIRSGPRSPKLYLEGSWSICWAIATVSALDLLLRLLLLIRLCNSPME
jgi:hypothetical protein